MSDGWDDLFGDEDVPTQMGVARAGAEMNLSMPVEVWSAVIPVARADLEVAGLVQPMKNVTPEPQPETDASESPVSSDGTGLFGSDEQFHVAWQHWNGMPEFHMDDLSPDSTLVVKFRTPEAREEFASLLRNVGIEIRKEEPRGIWYPKIEIAHFWDKRYRDAAVETTDNTPIMSEADEVDDSETQDEGAA